MNTKPELPPYVLNGYVMSAEQYRKAIDKIGLNQVRMAQFLGIGERTSRRWADPEHDNKAPAYIAMLTALMIKYDVTPVQAAKLAVKMFPE